ncbi:GNAT family N-acetyltransferase [Legionella hackeliae]|uniref:Gnat family acetyltransferase n=1 Tax=Legionella hackeliae TaxID=449 RepID=A0A0A8UWS4_LEGHA|nr:GNAT family N-acetyltransferase [Legionella hackeliae]KTD15431.1 GNAT family acetyltransferase [Legionella hackeliae]CEK11199.1 Gnat family acetyltransferase [Legionella hackeliae]STX47964.1 GNAT family acetyltransferase [Legionella hackeliae]
MTLKIDYLKQHPHTIEALAKIWQDEIGKIWCPDVSLTQIYSKLQNHLHINQLPIGKVAFVDNIPVGMSCLRVNDGIREEWTPWLGGLVVAKSYQGQRIGKMLIDSIITDAKKLGFSSIFLLTFDPTLPNYYKRLGWDEIEKNTYLGKAITIMRTVI